FTLALDWMVPLEDYGNDAFTNRAVLTGYTVFVRAQNTNATTEPGEVLPSGASGRTLWWTWTAPTSVLVRLNTVGSLFEGGSVPLHIRPTPGISGPLVAVYSGDSLTNLSLVASNSFLTSPPGH